MSDFNSTMLRQCVSCAVEYPEESFKLRSSKGRQSGTRHTMCNRCLYVKYTRPHAEKKLDEIRSYKLARGCADCGYADHPAALEFDHLPGMVKSFNIGEKVGTYSLSRIMEELEKCEVVCANCHAIRTAARRVRVEVTSANV